MAERNPFDDPNFGLPAQPPPGVSIRFGGTPNLPGLAEPSGGPAPNPFDDPNFSGAPAPLSTPELPGLLESTLRDASVPGPSGVSVFGRPIEDVNLGLLSVAADVATAPFRENGLQAVQNRIGAYGKSFMRAATAGTRGAYLGGAQAVGLPGDILHMVLKAGGHPNPAQVIWGSEEYKNAVRPFLPEVDDPSLLEDIYERSAQEAVGAGALLVGPIAAARAPADKLPSMVNLLLDAVRKNPAKVLEVEMGLGALVGAGAEIGEAITGGPGGELVGGLTAVGAPAGMKGLHRWWMDRFGSVSPEVAEQRAGEILKTFSADPAKVLRELTEYENLDLPTQSFSTAQVTGDPGMRVLENYLLRGRQSLRTKQGNVVLHGQLESLREQARRDIVSATDEVVGALHGPQATQDVLGQKLDALKERVTDRVNAATQIADRAQLAVLGAGSRAEAREAMAGSSRVLRGELESALNDARAQERKLWEAVPGSTPVNVQRVVDRVLEMEERLLPEELASGQWPKKIADLVKGYAPDGADLEGIEGLATSAELPFERLKALRTLIREQRTNALAAAEPRRQEARWLNQIEGEIIRTMEQGVDTGGLPPEVAVAYNTARAYSRHLNDVFTTGPAGKVFEIDRSGREVLLPEATAAAYFGKASSEKQRAGAKLAAQQFESAVGGNQEALSAAEEYLRSSLYDAAVKPDGRLDGRLYAKWLDDHRAGMRQFPELFGKFARVNRANEQLEALTRAGKRKISEYEKGAARHFLGNREPVAAVDAAMHGAEPEKKMAELFALVKDHPAAAQGLRRGVFEALARRYTGTIGRQRNSVWDDPKSMLEGISKHQKALRAVGYSEQDVDQLFKVAKANELWAQTMSPGNLSQVSLENAVRWAPQLASIQSRMWGVKRGVVSPAYVLTDLGLRTLRNVLGHVSDSHLDELLGKAAVDPSFARFLMQRATPANEELLARQLKAHLASFGIPLAEELQW